MAADTLGLSLDSLPPATSDAREEPLPSTQAVLDTPPDPASIPVHAPTGQTPPPEPGHLLPEVEMAEAVEDSGDASHNPYFDAPSTVNGVNGVAADLNGDHEMSEEVSASVSEPAMPVTAKIEPEEQPMQTSVSLPGTSTTTIDAATFHNLTNGNTNGNVRPHPDSDDGAPPAKRARKLSDPDSASLNHTNGASAPPSSSAPSPRHVAPPLSTAQLRFMLATVRTLKRMKDAAPFLQPVDPIALNIRHYPTIITHPMDLGTVERKLNASNPNKPDHSSAVGRYRTVDEFTADIRLIFANCEKFNGPEHAITLMAKRLEEVFDKQIKQLPPSEDVKPVVKKQTPPLPPAPAPVPPKKAPVRRPSAAQPAAPAARRSDPDVAALSRPKREIHPPAPKDVPNYPELPKRTRVKKKDDGTQEQLKFCARLIQEMYKKQHWQIAAPFYEPVDWHKLEIPSYPKIIKKPMDLLTMKKKLDNHQYTDALKFYADFKLMIRNCFTFNPPGTPVHNAGQALSALFEDKWHGLPPLREAQSENDDDDDEESDEDDDTINALTSQLESVKSNLNAALHKKKNKKKDDKKRKLPSQPKASGSGSKAYNGGGSSSKKKSKTRVADVDEVLSFDQKKELSETIQTLEGQKLERVINIIHEGVPDIRNSTEEIELDIDQLPPAVLLKLYNTVMRPIKAKSSGRPAAGPARHSSHGGTGGLKRKSMDEEAEAERIRLLEERIRLFDKDPASAQGQGSGASSDSSDSDSSSDSD